MSRRRHLLVAPVVAAVLAVVAPACTPTRSQVASPTTTTSTTTPPTPSSCSARNEDSVASFDPAGVTAEAARAQTIRKDRLVVGVSADTMQIGSRGPDAEIVGFDIDIAREIARVLFGDPSRVELKVLTVPQRIPALVDGEVDIVANSLTVTCARWNQINFSTEYLRAGQRLLVRQDDAARGITTLDQLAGRRVCTSASGTGMDTLRSQHPRITPVGVQDRADCLVKFQQGEVDAILNGDNLLAGFIPQDQFVAVIVGQQLNAEPTAIGIKKGNTELTRFVNKALEEIRRTTWRSIYDRWLGGPLGPPTEGFAPPPAVYGRTP